MQRALGRAYRERRDARDWPPNWPHLVAEAWRQELACGYAVGAASGWSNWWATLCSLDGAALLCLLLALTTPKVLGSLLFVAAATALGAVVCELDLLRRSFGSLTALEPFVDSRKLDRLLAEAGDEPPLGALETPSPRGKRAPSVLAGASRTVLTPRQRQIARVYRWRRSLAEGWGRYAALPRLPAIALIFAWLLDSRDESLAAAALVGAAVGIVARYLCLAAQQVNLVCPLAEAIDWAQLDRALDAEPKALSAATGGASSSESAPARPAARGNVASP